MEWMRSYVLTLAAAGILCAMVKSLSGGKAGGRMLGLACGVFLVFAAVSPVYTMDLDTWTGDWEGLRAESGALQEAAQNMVQNQMDVIIKERTAAYILDKAESLGASLAVEVSLTENEGYHTPESVCITGMYSQYMKTRLEDLLERELGIPKDRQEWKE